MTTEPVTEEKAPEPKSLLEKLGAALPVALTMIATTFAGMTSAQLQQAMFWRSFAAQDQAKATSQWTFAGFKRDRALICETTSLQLRISANREVITHQVSAKPEGKESAEDSEKRIQTETEAVKWLAGQGPPRLKLPEITDEALLKLLEGIRNRENETEVLKRAAKVTQKAMNSSLDEAEKWVDDTDKSWEPILRAATRITDRVTTSKTSELTTVAAAQASKMELEQRRYRAEATFNQQLALLYEARVKVSTAESDKHRRKSENFFYAMLAAQVGATIASLALARKQKSLLWLLAGVAGAISIGVGIVVFMM